MLDHRFPSGEFHNDPPAIAAQIARSGADTLAHPSVVTFLEALRTAVMGERRAIVAASKQRLPAARRLMCRTSRPMVHEQLG
jgi:hypothetical protein